MAQCPISQEATVDHKSLSPELELHGTWQFKNVKKFSFSHVLPNLVPFRSSFSIVQVLSDTL